MNRFRGLILLMTILGILACGSPDHHSTREDATFEMGAVYGLSALASGHPNFPCEALSTFYDAAPTVYHGTLWQTFGNDRKCWERIFKYPKRVYMQFYLSNETCRKKSNCADYELHPRLSVDEYNGALESYDPSVVEAVREALIAIIDFCQAVKKDGDECLIALGLESQFTPEALLTLVKIAKEVGWKHEQIIHNPLDNLDIGHAHILERHGLYFQRGDEPLARYNHSFDGLYSDLCRVQLGPNSYRVSFEELRELTAFARNQARFVGFWCPEWQGLTSDSSTAPLPRARSFTVERDSLDGFRTIAGYRT